MAASSNQISLLECLSCNARGTMIWGVAGDNGPKTPIGVAGDFHIETGRTKSGRKIIVCTQCDEIYGVFPG